MKPRKITITLRFSTDDDELTRKIREEAMNAAWVAGHKSHTFVEMTTRTEDEVENTPAKI